MALFTVKGDKLQATYDRNGIASEHQYDLWGGYDLSVMSYNVGGWYYNGWNMPSALHEAYYDMQAGIFDKYDPDYVGIQEYKSLIGDEDALAFLSARYETVFAVDKSSAGAGRAVASKFEMTDVTDNLYEYQSDEKRYYIKGYITVRGKRICVISTHLCYKGDQSMQANELASVAAKEDYCIVVGDFNADVNTEDGRNAVVKPFTDLGFIAANGGAFGVFDTHHDESMGGWRALDLIFTTPNIRIVDVCADQTKVTDEIDGIIDHVALAANLMID